MKLKELLTLNNLNQTELAQQIGVSQKTISNYLSGETEPTLSVLCKIAKFFGVSLDYLCDYKVSAMDISYYSETAKDIVKKLSKIKEDNLKKLNAICEGLIIGQ